MIDPSGNSPNVIQRLKASLFWQDSLASKLASRWLMSRRWPFAVKLYPSCCCCSRNKLKHGRLRTFRMTPNLMRGSQPCLNGMKYFVETYGMVTPRPRLLTFLPIQAYSCSKILLNFLLKCSATEILVCVTRWVIVTRSRILLMSRAIFQRGQGALLHSETSTPIATRYGTRVYDCNNTKMLHINQPWGMVLGTATLRLQQSPPSTFANHDQWKAILSFLLMKYPCSRLRYDLLQHHRLTVYWFGIHICTVL